MMMPVPGCHFLSLPTALLRRRQYFVLVSSYQTISLQDLGGTSTVELIQQGDDRTRGNNLNLCSTHAHIAF